MKTCSEHPNARAAWICTKCELQLCPMCAASDVAGRASITRCVHCGGLADLLMMLKPIRPYWAMFPTFLGAIFSLAGLIQILVVSATMYLFSLIPILGGILAAGVYAGYYFLVIRQAAYGAEKLPALNDLSDIFESILSPLLRFVLASAILWVPALLFINADVGLQAVLADPIGTLSEDPVLALIVILSLLYFPAAIITAAITESALAMLNPLVILGVVLRIPAHYLITMVVWGMMILADTFLQSRAAGWLELHYVKVLTPIVLNIMGLIVPMLTAFMLGRLVYQNGEKLGFRADRNRQVPEMPNASARGNLRPDLLADRHAASAPVQPIELESAAAASPKGAELALATGLETGEDTAALEAYHLLQSQERTPQLQPQLELRLANLLERSGSSMEAALACRRAAEQDLRGPLAPRAIFTAARLLTERVGNPEQGAGMFRYLIDNYPEDALAERAQEMLRRLEADRG